VARSNLQAERNSPEFIEPFFRDESSALAAARRESELVIAFVGVDKAEVDGPANALNISSYPGGVKSSPPAPTRNAISDIVS